MPVGFFEVTRVDAETVGRIAVLCAAEVRPNVRRDGVLTGPVPVWKTKSVVITSDLQGTFNYGEKSAMPRKKTGSTTNEYFFGPPRFKCTLLPVRRTGDAEGLIVESGQIVYYAVLFQSFESFDDGVPIFWSVLGHFNQITSGS